MSPAAETRGVSSPGSLSLVAWEPLLSLRRSPCGRISLTEAWRSCHQEGGGAAFGPVASPTLRAGAPEAPTDAVD